MDQTTEHRTTSSLYETDFVTWTERTARFIRSGQLEDVDWANVAGEIESLGKSDRRELKSRLEVLLLYLLKWQYQPQLRCGSCENTIDEQRNRIQDLLLDSPSLNPYLREILAECYHRGQKAAGNETSLPLETFPSECPYLVTEILDKEFLPEALDTDTLT